MLVTQISIDLAGLNRFEYVIAKQADENSRLIQVQLLDNGKVYVLDNKATARVSITKPDKTEVLADCTIDNNMVDIDDVNSDLTDVYDGSIVWNDGAFIDQEHRILSDTSRCFSEFILCPPKGKIRFLAETGNKYVSAISFYDDENRLLTNFSNLSSGEQTVDIPSDAKYFRLSGLTYNKNKYYYKFVDVSLLGHIEDMSDDLEKRVSDLENLINVKESYNLLNVNNMLENRLIDSAGNIVVNEKINLSERIYVDNAIKLRTTTNLNQYLAQFNADGTLVGYTSNFNSSNPIALNEETDYIFLSAWKDALPFSVYQSEKVLPYIDYSKSSDAIRNIVEIYNSDTEEEIYLKMYEAYKKGNCDVYWETGIYEFSTIFELLKTKYNRNTAYELPIGGNCRYFFNGSRIIGTGVSEDSNVIGNSSIFGTWRTAQSYELYDGIFVANHLIYCVHEEASGQEIPYRIKYHNMRMIHNTVTDDYDKTYGLRKCIGCGTGLNPIVEVSNCWFQTDHGMDIGWHGHAKDNETTFYINIHDCWFSHGISTDKMSTHETAELLFHGNSSPVIPMSNHDGVKGWKVVSWNNEKRTS